MNQLAEASQTALKLLENVRRVIVGKEKAIEMSLVALFAQGHLLIEDVPGLGKTTLAKAKETRIVAEKLITHGKKGNLHHRRLALAQIPNKKVVEKVFEDVAPRYAEREGGYTRIVKLGPRQGDAAQMAVIELV